jgi:hypothetical protein
MAVDEGKFVSSKSFALRFKLNDIETKKSYVIKRCNEQNISYLYINFGFEVVYLVILRNDG